MWEGEPLGLVRVILDSMGEVGAVTMRLLF